jgi:hypothetical protein
LLQIAFMILQTLDVAIEIADIFEDIVAEKQ